MAPESDTVKIDNETLWFWYVGFVAGIAFSAFMNRTRTTPYTPPDPQLVKEREERYQKERVEAEDAFISKIVKALQNDTSARSLG